MEVHPLPGERVALRLTPEEEEKLQKLEADFPERGAEFRDALTDARVSGLHLTNNPSAQRILDQIYAARAKRADSVVRAEWRAVPEQMKVLVARPDQWADSLAAAIVIERGGAAPNNIILLPPNATGDNLALGIRAITQLRQHRTSDTAQNLRIVVRGSAIQAGWRSDVRARMATGVVRGLDRMPITTLAGIGPVRATEITVAVRP